MWTVVFAASKDLSALGMQGSAAADSKQHHLETMYLLRFFSSTWLLLLLLSVLWIFKSFSPLNSVFFAEVPSGRCPSAVRLPPSSD